MARKASSRFVFKFFYSSPIKDEVESGTLWAGSCGVCHDLSRRRHWWTRAWLLVNHDCTHSTRTVLRIQLENHPFLPS